MWLKVLQYIDDSSKSGQYFRLINSTPINSNFNKNLVSPLTQIFLNDPEVKDQDSAEKAYKLANLSAYTEQLVVREKIVEIFGEDDNSWEKYFLVAEGNWVIAQAGISEIIKLTQDIEQDKWRALLILLQGPQTISEKVEKVNNLKATAEMNGVIEKSIANWHMCTGGNDGVSIVIEHLEKMVQLEGISIKNISKIMRITGNEGDEEKIKTNISTVFKNLSLDRDQTQYIKNLLTTFDMGGNMFDIEKETIFQTVLTDAKLIYNELLDYFIVHPEELANLSFFHNFFSLSVHPSGTIALYNLIKDLRLNSLIIHHDFLEKREHFQNMPAQWEMVSRFFKPRIFGEMSWVSHAVINTRDQTLLKTRYGLDSLVIYNPEDFSQLDNFNQNSVDQFRSILGVAENEELAVQGTRVIARKEIQLAIESIADHNRRHPARKRHLAILGTPADQQNDKGGYYEFLQQLIDKNNSWEYIHFVGSMVHNKKDNLDQNLFSFRTMYQASDIFYYFSSEEGFGNNLLEAIKYSLNADLFSKVFGMLDRRVDRDFDFSNGSDFYFAINSVIDIIGESSKSIMQDLDISDFNVRYSVFKNWLDKNQEKKKEFLNWLNQPENIRKAPAIGVLGGKGVGYQVYFDDIESLGINFDLISDEDVVIKKDEKTGFKYYIIKNKDLVDQIESELVNENDQLKNIFRAITNYAICMKNFSYQALVETIAESEACERAGVLVEH